MYEEYNQNKKELKMPKTTKKLNEMDTIRNDLKTLSEGLSPLHLERAFWQASYYHVEDN